MNKLTIFLLSAFSTTVFANKILPEQRRDKTHLNYSPTAVGWASKTGGALSWQNSELDGDTRGSSTDDLEIDARSLAGFVDYQNFKGQLYLANLEFDNNAGIDTETDILSLIGAYAIPDTKFTVGVEITSADLESGTSDLEITKKLVGFGYRVNDKFFIGGGLASYDEDNNTNSADYYGMYFGVGYLDGKFGPGQSLAAEFVLEHNGDEQESGISVPERTTLDLNATYKREQWQYYVGLERTKSEYQSNAEILSNEFEFELEYMVNKTCYIGGSFDRTHSENENSSGSTTSETTIGTLAVKGGYRTAKIEANAFLAFSRYEEEISDAEYDGRTFGFNVGYFF